jgi:hypothetical protein
MAEVFLPHPQSLCNWKGERFCEAAGLFAKKTRWNYLHFFSDFYLPVILFVYF